MNEYEHECKPEDATVDKCIDLSEGDLLYLPPKLYHRVDTLGPRISISFHFHAPSERKHWREEWLDWIGDINGAAK
jgi:ribosomal protein L16 Arg81 hydroxylase